ncbi:MAG: hypothetical protein ABI691_10315 [Ginsengibacter sp.]
MKTVEEQIKEINKKLQHLVKKYAALQRENTALFCEINGYREKEKAEMEKINILEMQTSILKASAGKMNDGEKFEFEKRINRYIKDLEKCMTMLNK